jgi:hypothetical protein
MAKKTARKAKTRKSSTKTKTKKSRTKKSAAKKPARKTHKEAAGKKAAKTRDRKTGTSAKKISSKKRTVKKAAKPVPKKPGAASPAPVKKPPVDPALLNTTVSMTLAPQAGPHPAQSAASRIAVVDCVNQFMDNKRPGWNADGQGDTRKMGADYNFPPPSIPAPVLSSIRNCLAPKHFTFQVTPALVAACAAGTVADLKYEIWMVTT